MPGLPITAAQNRDNEVEITQAITRGHSNRISRPGGFQYFRAGAFVRVTEWRGMERLAAEAFADDLVIASEPDQYSHVISITRQPGDLWNVRRSIEDEFDYNIHGLDPATIAERIQFHFDTYQLPDDAAARHPNRATYDDAVAGKNKVYAGPEIVSTGYKNHSGTKYRYSVVNIPETYVGMGFYDAVRWANNLFDTQDEGLPPEKREYNDRIRVDWDGSGLYTVTHVDMVIIDDRPDTPNVVWSFYIGP